MVPDEMVGIRKEVILVYPVAKFPEFFNESPGGPVSIHQTPSSVDVDCIPGVLIFVWIESHAGFVTDPFSIANNDSGVYSRVTENIGNN